MWKRIAKWPIHIFHGLDHYFINEIRNWLEIVIYVFAISACVYCLEPRWNRNVHCIWHELKYLPEINFRMPTEYGERILRTADRRSRLNWNWHSIESYTSVDAGRQYKQFAAFSSIGCRSNSDCHSDRWKMEWSKLHSKCHKYGMFTCHKSISIYCICLRVYSLHERREYFYDYFHFRIQCSQHVQKYGTRWVREKYASWSHAQNDVCTGE